MVVPAPRDPGVTREILTGWFGDPARLPGARITDLRTPEFTGFSSEILMVDVEHDRITDATAVRVAPSHCRVAGDPAVRRHRLVSTRPGQNISGYYEHYLASSAVLKNGDSSRNSRLRCRFAVRRPGIPETSPRSHGMPCRGLEL